MTMRLELKNTDEARAAHVKYVDKGEDGTWKDANATTSPPVEIPPGETREVWIHSTRRIEVTEL